MKSRHGARNAKGVVEGMGEGKGRVVLDEMDGGLAPGQYIAFYDDDGVCVGSSVIAEG